VRAARVATTQLVVAALLFSLMALSVKLLTTRLAGPQISLMRFGFGLLSVAASALWRPLAIHNGRGLLLRGTYGGLAVLCYFQAIEHLPVGFATLLNYIAPVFTALYAGLLLGERLSHRAHLALGVGFLGTILVIVGNRASAPPGTFGFGLWQVVGLSSALFSGAAMATIREVRRTDGPREIFGTFCLIGGLMSAGPAVTRWLWPTPSEWLWLVVMGALSVTAQLLMTAALRHVQAALGGVIMQLTPVTSLVLGALWFGERSHGLATVGAVVTLLGVSWGAWEAASPVAPTRRSSTGSVPTSAAAPRGPRR
jgi:drug/metabolite transporter (DMT)-like permease